MHYTSSLNSPENQQPAAEPPAGGCDRVSERTSQPGPFGGGGGLVESSDPSSEPVERAEGVGGVEPAKAIELFHADGRSAGVFYCAKCRTVKRTKEEAEQCCGPFFCHVCKVVEMNSTMRFCACDSCRDRQEREREQARFDRAEKVTEWTGPVVEPDGDRYGMNLAELLEYFDEEDRPEYVWTCHERPVCHLDYDRIIEQATQDAYEDFDPGSLDGETELRVALEAFNDANKKDVVWEPNYKKALVLGTAGRAAAAGCGDVPSRHLEPPAPNDELSDAREKGPQTL